MAFLRFFTDIQRTTLILLSAILLAACPQPQPQIGEREYNGFWYVVDVYLNGVIEITNYTGTETDIRIPERIENLPVVLIRGRQMIFNPDVLPPTYTNGAFENKKLASVILPKNIRHINDGAFANNNLTEIHFPDNLSWISSSAFMNNRLTGVIVIPDSVWFKIGSQAFEGNQITGVTIGSGIEYIGYAAFRDNKIASLTIPSNVATIESWAFKSNEIAELNLTVGLTSIAAYAFEDNRLTNLSIPAGVGIAYGAFKGNDITRISVGEDVRLYSSISPVFELGFDEFYLENDEQAGDYVYENGEWEFIGDI